MPEKFTLEYVHQWLKENRPDGKCLSTEYVNVYTKMKWECKCKHTWDSTFNNIKNCKTWCPTCSSSGNPKLIIEEIEVGK